MAKFVERQFKHSSIEARKNLADLQRQIVDDSRDQDDIEFCGAKGKEGFRVYLKKRFGSVVAGWRVVDTDKTGRLSFYEFCNGCRAMGYHGNMKKLWNELDVNQNGSVSLMDIDPEVGYYVGTFKLALIKKYGDILTAWQKCFDPNDQGRIEEKQIASALETLGLSELSPKKLYGMLRTGAGVGVSLAEFDPDAYNMWISGEATKQRAKLVDAEGEMMKETVESNKNKNSLGLHTAEGFKAALINRCGSLLQAWRESLDLDGKGRLTFGEFTQAMSRLGFHGNVLGLWKQLDARGTGFLLFKDLDEETQTSLDSLRSKLVQEYGNTLLAWVQGFDTKGSGVCKEAQFVKVCAKVGYEGDASKLFKVMQPDTSRKCLTLRDFDTKAYLAMCRGDFRMISERHPNSKRPLDMSFEERMQEGFFYQIRRAWEAARREEFAQACRTMKPEANLHTKEEFEQLCVRRFGSVISAWRQCLDNDQTGRLTFNEFCQASRRLGYDGDLKSLWSQFDVTKKGFISLKDLDPKADEVVSSFLMMLGAKYGTLDAAWKHGFLKGQSESIHVNELVDACKALEYPHDPMNLFQCLQPVPGRQTLTIWDLDPSCSRKLQRGDPMLLSKPKSGAADESVHPRNKGGSKLAGTDSHQENIASEDGNAQVAEPHIVQSGGDNLVSPEDEKPTSGEEKQARGSKSTPLLASRSQVLPEPVQSSLCLGGVTMIQNLRQVLKKKYGSTLAGWRASFDPHMTGKVGFGKFMIVVENCAFHGNVKSLWQELSAGEAMATFKDVDPEAQQIVDSTREQLVNQFGSLLAAWQKGLDLDGMGRLTESDFQSSTEKLGWTPKASKKVFNLLLSRRGARSILISDLEALLTGLPGPERPSVWAGPRSDPTRAKPQEGTERLPSVPLDVTSPREFMDMARTRQQSEDFVICTIDAFKKMLVTKYGSLFAGWRHGLDVDQNGVVTQRDFAQRCQLLGIKAVQRLWNDLDVKRKGQISMLELDEETGQAFASFEKLLIEKYGDCKTGWKKCFDPEKTVQCDKVRFVKQCQVLGYGGDAERLFKLLRPEAGRPQLTYEDLWLNLNPNDFARVNKMANTTSPATSPKARSGRQPLDGTQEFEGSRTSTLRSPSRHTDRITPSHSTVEQPLEPPTDQTTNVLVSQQASQPVDQPADHAATQKVEQSIDQSSGQPTNQPVEQPVARSVENTLDPN
eukprot:TRINITY_DN54653_c0_g1_i1.p1 TRINITY_DN54653_c0_g1~~TRINITY_DN54653_c0_g1_i1.p1  ORF type:complete len:1318 (-),score=202.09 TRINITY_DN54653_c0_g1_i1:132-3737(-)